MRTLRSLVGRWKWKLASAIALGAFAGMFASGTLPPDLRAIGPVFFDETEYGAPHDKSLVEIPQPFQRRLKTIYVAETRDKTRRYTERIAQPTLTIEDLSWFTQRQLIFSRPLTPPLEVSPNGDLLAVCLVEWNEDTSFWRRVGQMFNLPEQAAPASVCLVRHTNGEVVAEFPEARSAKFSNSADTLAVTYEDRTEFYDLHLRHDWRHAWLVGAAVFGCCILLSSAFGFAFRLLFCQPTLRCTAKP